MVVNYTIMRPKENEVNNENSKHALTEYLILQYMPVILVETRPQKNAVVAKNTTTIRFSRLG
jgi:hypothetical protein